MEDDAPVIYGLESQESKVEGKYERCEQNFNDKKKHRRFTKKMRVEHKIYIIKHMVQIRTMSDARAITAQVAETEAIRFIVGTQSLRCDNQDEFRFSQVKIGWILLPLPTLVDNLNIHQQVAAQVIWFIFKDTRSYDFWKTISGGVVGENGCILEMISYSTCIFPKAYIRLSQLVSKSPPWVKRGGKGKVNKSKPIAPR
ncbi:EARP-interacting [Nymphon striatum]|nr:EARP-interacting [Nymphon striatum]